MTMRRRSPVRRARSPRRKVSWESLAFEFSLTAAASGGKADLSPEPMQTVHAGVGTATLHRAILHYDVTYLDGNVDLGQSFLSTGLVVVSQDGFSGGTLPDPESDFNQDWYYWTRRMHKQNIIDNPPITSWDADIRSKRRLRGGYTLALRVQNPINPDPLEVHVSMRLLWSQEP